MPGQKKKALIYDRSDLFFTALKHGLNFKNAAAYAGITEQTVYGWRRRGEAEIERLADSPRAKVKSSEKAYVEFVEAYGKAVAAREEALAERVYLAAVKGFEIEETVTETHELDERTNTLMVTKRVVVTKRYPPDWKAAIALLERRHDREWSRTQKVEVFNWKTELLDAYEQGDISIDDIRNELEPDLAEEFFKFANIMVIDQESQEIES